MRRILLSAVLIIAAGLAHSADPKEWETEGRPLPERRLPPPALDDALPAACSAQIDGKLEGSAPAILPRLVDHWLAAFRARFPRVEISVPPPYLAPQAALNPRMRLFLEGRLDFAFVSRDLSAADTDLFRRAHGYDPLSIPIAGGSFAHFGFVDAVSIIVHRDNPLDRLTFAQVDAIFSRSRLRGAAPVKTWDDLGIVQWAGRPVRVVGGGAWIGEESARAIVIRDRILSLGDRRGEWRTDVDAKSTEAQVPEEVAADRNAIGFTGMGHLGRDTKPVALAGDALGPYYEPSYENVARATYPLSRVVHIVVAKKPGAALDPALDAFVHFLLSKEGQRVVRDQGVLLPLRAWQVAESLRLLGGSSACGIQPPSAR
jgi:phosphate transport system substrate-binding protein